MAAVPAGPGVRGEAGTRSQAPGFPIFLCRAPVMWGGRLPLCASRSWTYHLTLAVALEPGGRGLKALPQNSHLPQPQFPFCETGMEPTAHARVLRWERGRVVETCLW